MARDLLLWVCAGELHKEAGEGMKGFAAAGFLVAIFMVGWSWSAAAQSWDDLGRGSGTQGDVALSAAAATGTAQVLGQGNLQLFWLPLLPYVEDEQDEVDRVILGDIAEGFGATASASGLFGAYGTNNGEYLLARQEQWEGRVWAGVLLFGAGYRASFQRSTALDAPYWRSGRGIFAHGFEVNGPRIRLPITEKWFIHIPEIVFVYESLYFDRRGGLDRVDAFGIGLDMTWVAFSKPGERENRVVFLDISLQTYGVPIRVVGNHTRALGTAYTGVSILKLEDLALGRSGLGMGLDLGVEALHATGEIHRSIVEEQKGDTRSVSLDIDLGEPTLAGGFAQFQLGWRQGEHPGIVAEFGSFRRLDPTGFRVDEGWEAKVEGGLRLVSGWELLGSGSIIQASPKGWSDRTPVEVREADPGAFTLTRVSSGLSVELGQGWKIEGTGWWEHSDRDDPIALGGAVPVGTRNIYGAQTSLRWSWEVLAN